VDNPLPGVPAVFDHVAVAGPSIRSLLPLYADALGGRFRYGGVNAQVGFRAVTLGYPDGSKIELLEALPDSGFLDSFLARNGGLGGLHHVTFFVPDLAAAVAAVEALGLRVFGVTLNDPYWSEAFVHPAANQGVLLQLATPGPHLAEAHSGRTLEDVLVATEMLLG
jgi:methylmalonyl-CoA/ethylmalonyl-CoA epimerase